MAKGYFPELESVGSETELGENHSLTKMLRLVGDSKRVVDFGCASGYFARLLRNKGCQVVGVEISEKAAKLAERYCEQVVVADLDFVSIAHILSEQTFDVAVFGDVLEHLRNPWRVLEEVHKILQPEGYVVASIPNIAHGAIRLALLQGKFDYADVGILDNTHLRFFTRKTVEELFDRTGYLIDSVDRTVVPVFSDSNIVPRLNRSTFDSELIQQIEQEEEAETLQFVLRAYRASLSTRFTVLSGRYSKLVDELEQLQVQHRQTQLELGQTHTALEYSQIQLQQTQEHAHNLEAALEHSQIQFQQTQTHVRNLEATLEHSQIQLQETREHTRYSELALQEAQAQLQQIETELEQLQSQLTEAQDELAGVHDHLTLTHCQLQHSQSQLHEAKAVSQHKQGRIKLLRAKLEQKELEKEQFRVRITAMESSKFWQIRTAWVKFKRLLGAKENPIWIPADIPLEFVDVPSNPKQKGEAQKVGYHRPLSVNQREAYERWIKHHSLTKADLEQMAELAEVFAHKPLISVIVPAHNTPKSFLEEAIESVINQVYPFWELCIADDASTEPHVKKVLKKYAAQDSRIKVVFREENGHIARCSNSALELATGEYIALLDHDDVLPPEALYEIAFLLNRHPEADMIYSDEDKIDENGKRCCPYFKPDWCPDSFLCRMYTCHLGVYRRSIVNEIGGFRAGYEGSQDYDLVLRFTEKTDKIFHIPKILYHWRIHTGSIASNSSAKPYAYEAGQRAIEDALRRRGENGIVSHDEKHLGVYIIRYDIPQYKLVSIIIPTRDLGHTLNQCLESIFAKSTYPNYEVILIDNDSTEPYTEKIIKDWLNKEPERFKCYSLRIPFNYSKINNYAVTKANGDFLLFLNNDTEVVTPDWIEAMVEQAQRPSIGAVGSLLLYPDDTIQHAGVVLGIAGVAGHSHKHFSATESGYYTQINCINNYSAVTGACLMCKREVFEAIGGFNEEDLKIAFNDIDLCLKMVAKGLKNIYLPHVVLYHYESKSRGYDTTPEKQFRFIKEIEYMQKHWKQLFEHDPCYSPNLTLQHEDYSIKEYDATEREFTVQLKRTENKLRHLEAQLEQTKQERAQAINRITAMETSKFWKLRRSWFQLKQLIGVAGQKQE